MLFVMLFPSFSAGLKPDSEQLKNFKVKRVAGELPPFVFVIEVLKFGELIPPQLGLVGCTVCLWCEDFGRRTKSLEGSRCIAWAIISFNMERLDHHHKGG
jgi:hypothetical protein